MSDLFFELPGGDRVEAFQEARLQRIYSGEPDGFMEVMNCILHTIIVTRGVVPSEVPNPHSLVRVLDHNVLSSVKESEAVPWLNKAFLGARALLSSVSGTSLFLQPSTQRQLLIKSVNSKREVDVQKAYFPDNILFNVPIYGDIVIRTNDSKGDVADLPVAAIGTCTEAAEGGRGFIMWVACFLTSPPDVLRSNELVMGSEHITKLRIDQSGCGVFEQIQNSVCEGVRIGELSDRGVGGVVLGEELSESRMYEVLCKYAVSIPNFVTASGYFNMKRSRVSTFFDEDYLQLRVTVPTPVERLGMIMVLDEAWNVE
jgi:hypothetical protein